MDEKKGIIIIQELEKMKTGFASLVKGQESLFELIKFQQEKIEKLEEIVLEMKKKTECDFK